jgi:hypothetical protein
VDLRTRRCRILILRGSWSGEIVKGIGARWRRETTFGAHWELGQHDGTRGENREARRPTGRVRSYLFVEQRRLRHSDRKNVAISNGVASPIALKFHHGRLIGYGGSCRTKMHGHPVGVPSHLLKGGPGGDCV